MYARWRFRQSELQAVKAEIMNAAAIRAKIEQMRGNIKHKD